MNRSPRGLGLLLTGLLLKVAILSTKKNQNIQNVSTINSKQSKQTFRKINPTMSNKKTNKYERNQTIKKKNKQIPKKNKKISGTNK